MRPATPAARRSSFTLDTTAPAVTEQLKNDTGTSATDKNTSDPTVTGSGDPNALVSFAIDGVSGAATTTADGAGSWTFTPMGLADGSHTIVASETDHAGNTGTASLSFTLDTTAPAVTEQLKNDTGTSATDKNTSDPTVTGSGDPNALVSFAIDGVSGAATTTADGAGSWTFTPMGLADGSHTIVASETDHAGNTGTASLSFTLDTTAPAVTEQLKNDTSGGSLITSDDTLIGSSDPNALVTITDGATVLGTANADGSGAWTFAPSGLGIGTHTVVASETDIAGNTGTASLTFTLVAAASSPPTLVVPPTLEFEEDAADSVRHHGHRRGQHHHHRPSFRCQHPGRQRPHLHGREHHHQRCGCCERAHARCRRGNDDYAFGYRQQQRRQYVTPVHFPDY